MKNISNLIGDWKHRDDIGVGCFLHYLAGAHFFFVQKIYINTKSRAFYKLVSKRKTVYLFFK